MALLVLNTVTTEVQLGSAMPVVVTRMYLCNGDGVTEDRYRELLNMGIARSEGYPNKIEAMSGTVKSYIRGIIKVLTVIRTTTREIY